MSHTTPGLVTRYHDQTKHHVNRFARSLGYLDWATQPNPFRSFDGAPRVDLVEPFHTACRPDAAGRLPVWLRLGYDELFRAPAAPRIEPGLGAVSVFFRYSLGLSAWKQAGSSRWALRVNPSSGNLHPTEGYAVLGPDVVDKAASVCHYAPDRHALERRCVCAPEGSRTLAAALPAGAFLVGLTSIHWREAWKYGERAFRYCQHDTGHALAAMRMAAAMMGWDFRVLPGWSTASVFAALGLDRDSDFAEAEPEEAACQCMVSPQTIDTAALPRADAVISALHAGAWTGCANRLSPDHVSWEWIDAVAKASRVTAAAVDLTAIAGLWMPIERPGPCAVSTASTLLLQRRSAVDLDGHSTMPVEAFLFMLRRLLPGPWPPWDAFWWRPRVHLVLFVHRVDGLAPGIYVLLRSPAALDLLQRRFHQDFAWVHPSGVPTDLPLYLLTPLDCRRVARQLSCTQDIAAEGCFTLGMLAEFDAAIEEHGPSFYRNLFWETGAIGHMLYLEAEAAGVRGTGIGCFFDDAVHEILGGEDHSLQSLYHFTVGTPVGDARLQTRPGYDWE